jgi:hypothetical protein
MFDPATIGAAATVVKTAKELFSEYKNSKAKQKLEPQIHEVLGQLDSVQASAISVSIISTIGHAAKKS